SLGNEEKICLTTEDFQVKGISCNSKEVREGFVFIAIRGTKADGSEFIEEAIKRGAEAIVLQSAGHGAIGIGQRLPASTKIPIIQVKDARRALAKLAQKFYGNPSSKIKVVGITGTNGKTTISYLIEAIIKEAGYAPSVIGTINYRFKDKIIPSKNTTPAPIELQSLLAQMLKTGIDYSIIEVSSHALHQDRTEGMNFHSAIFTNLTQDHLDYHKTIDNYYKSKEKLFRNLKKNSFAVINNDDKYGLKLKSRTKAEVVTYGIVRSSSVMAKDLRFGCRSTSFKLLTPKGKIEILCPLIGLHNVYNVLASCAWAQREDIRFEAIKSAIEKFAPVPGRLERIDFDGKFKVFVDYAHTEDALKNIIASLRRLCRNRLIVVFGCGGDRDKTKRPKMGRVVSELADYAIVTSDNPRSEEPWQIINEIRKGIRKDNYCLIPQRFEAIKRALSIAREGDIVLVAGKGHEDYQVLRDRIIHFDDRQVIRECLNSLNY
ncbi:MAG: UDP-N-acetylmuramoyl-L-alanyl-D-glutamate--2,6-diaminopimelate ligase, partial [Candidatus Omnitrophica bacterium]|nr:UDP-N-acetylmuramoyl-L-alanyl-D-glutamate--2,6-diaminopimelate ligase [Candidatus Omnitrophota bacterium]